MGCSTVDSGDTAGIRMGCSTVDSGDTAGIRMGCSGGIGIRMECTGDGSASTDYKYYKRGYAD